MSVLLILLVLTSSLTQIYCFNCSLIKPDDKYSGLSIYSRLDAKQNIEYWMKNSFGQEWRFELTDDAQIKPDDQSVREVSPPKLYTRLIDIKQTNGVNTGKECDVLDSNNPNESDYWRPVNCTSFSGASVVGKFKSTKNSILMGPYYLSDNIRVKELDRLNRTYKRFIAFDVMASLHCEGVWQPLEIEFCNNSFADQLSDDMFASLETTFKFYGKNDTQVLWFNINGRPKYCIQESRTELSSECKNAESLRQAFEGVCFPPDSKKPDAPPSASAGPIMWLWIAVTLGSLLFLS